MLRRHAGLCALAVLAAAALPQAPPVVARAAPPAPTVQQTPPVPVSDVVPAPAPDTTSRYALKGTPLVTWPAAGTGTVDLTGMTAGMRARAGSLPVWIGPASSTVDVTRAQVDVLAGATGDAAGVAGPVLSVARTDGGSKPGAVQLTVDYSGFASAAGGGFGDRLQLEQLPACALTTPALPECHGVPLPTANDVVAGAVSTQVQAPPLGAGGQRAGGSRTASATASGGGTLLAVTSTAAGGGGGDFTATSLKPSATWAAGGSSGDFSWSYPIRVPPSLGGPSPSIALAYDSQSLDGLTAATNNQPSWIGDGFSYDPGFIERSYKACADDGQSSSGDLCWGTDNATLVLPGHGGELIQDASDANLWHPKEDDGTRVQRLFDSSLANGARNGEHWKVTTTDGTQYFFGLNHLPGWTSGKPETASVAYAPVFGNNAGELCNSASGFAASSCQQAYRWSLDYVVDAHGNSMSLWYDPELNSYSRNRTDASVSQYVRASTLSRIDYGTRSGSDLSAQAPARVVFAVADRCVTAGATCTADKPNWPNWPDVPWDQQCASTTSCTGHYAPTFWSQKRLSQITTQVSNGDGTWRNVEQWTLGQQWLDPGDGNARNMFLRSIGHSGLEGGTATEPDLTLNGVPMNNRVDVDGSHSPIERFRVSSIVSETGGVTSVTYSGKDCVKDSKMPAGADVNTFRCFPAWWVPPFATAPVLDWFHKYVVTQVSESDGGMGSDTEVTSYAYPANGAAWHYDESELTPPSRKTWAQWRGYDTVTVTHGAAGTTQSQTVDRSFRGMDGDHLPSGTRSVTYSVNGTTYRDSNWWAGRTFEAKVLNGPGGAMVTDTLTEPFAFGPTASRTRNGVTVQAMVARTLRTAVHTALDGGRPDRVTQVTNTYDTNAADGPPGRLVTVDDRGDTATAADDVCTRTTYARSDSAYLYSLPVEQETVGVGCATAPDRSKDVLSDVRTWYDGATAFGTSVSRGDATRVEALSNWNGGSPTYVPTTRSTYDGNGRVLDSIDALGHKTSTAYTPASGGPVTSVAVTNPMGWVATSTLDPAWGLDTSTLDVSGRRTDMNYDGLGRLTAIWLPGRDRSSQTASATFAYVVRSSGGPTAVSTSRLNPVGTGYVTSYALYDGLLRPRQTQAPAADGSGGRVISETVYDSRGLTADTSSGFYNGVAPGTTLVVPSGDNVVPSQTVTIYDGAERPTASVLRSLGVEQWRTTTTYGGDRTDVTPPAGGTATSTWTDARGSTTRLDQTAGGTHLGSSVTTTYAYDHAGRRSSLSDAAGNSLTWAYDQLGRLASTSDPDSGHTGYGYDDANERTTTTDSRGLTLTTTYDSLGRRTAEYQGSTAGTRLAQWTYDTLVRGQLTSSTRFVSGGGYVSAATGFDPAGRPTGVSVTIPSSETGLAGTYRFGMTYAADGSPATWTSPAVGGLPAETLTYGYTSTGLPATVSGLTSYVTQTRYDPFGAPTMVDASSGAGKDLQQYWYRDAATQRLTRHLAFGSTTPSIPLDLHYTYDAAGNVTSIADQLAQYGAGYGPDDVQCFRYDFLARLSDAWTPATGGCAPDPTTAGLGGAAPYWQTYSYDGAGNRLTKVQHAVAGDTRTTYAYPAAGQAQPHALLSTTTSGPSMDKGDTFKSDPAGNVTARPGPSGDEALTWDAEGHLAAVTDSGGTTSYVYTPDGTRLLSHDPAGTTLYLPGMELHTSRVGQATATRYYALGSQVVGLRTPQGLTWTAQDMHGTALVTVRDGDFAVLKRYQDPFGVARGGATTWPDGHSFVGGPADPTGLIHLGAREYDPSMGRFISADPVLDPERPQAIGPFAYAVDSPATESDPDGLCVEFGDPLCELSSMLGRLLGTISHIVGSVVHSVAHGLSSIFNKVKSGVSRAVNRLKSGAVRASRRIGSAIHHGIVRVKNGLAGAGGIAGVAERGGIGRPFDCGVLGDPDAMEHCHTFVDKAGIQAYRHLNAQFSGCAWICVSLQFQHGQLQGGLGVGAPGIGGSLTWNNGMVENQGSVGASVCGADIVGPCYATANEVDDEGNWTGMQHMGGIAFGVGEVRAAGGYTVSSIDLGTGKVTGPKDPFPGSNRICRIAWWC